MKDQYKIKLSLPHLKLMAYVKLHWQLIFCVFLAVLSFYLLFNNIIIFYLSNINIIVKEKSIQIGILLLTGLILISTINNINNYFHRWFNNLSLSNPPFVFIDYLMWFCPGSA